MNYDAEKVQELASQIMKHKEAYYSGKPEISDQAYDSLEKGLRRIAPTHPVLDKVGSDEAIPSTQKVEHTVPMLSLFAKTYVEEDVSSWMESRDIVGTYKIDGNSLSLVYQDGKLVMGKTRGNGRVGENVSSKIAWVADCVPNLKESATYEVEGELYCSDSSLLNCRDAEKIS